MVNKIKYPDNMLMVIVNKERNRFALYFANEIKVQDLSLSYQNGRKYQKFMYTDFDLFLNNLIKLIPLSCNENIINKTITKEIEMLKRFKIFCEMNNINYISKTTNGDPVDGLINGFKFQAKYVSPKKDQLTLLIKSLKCSGKVNGKRIKRCYEEGDFDFMVIETKETANIPNKYNFCIIPANILIKRKILETQNNIGKTSFYICPPDYPKIHWSKKYWNDISSFK